MPQLNAFLRPRAARRHGGSLVAAALAAMALTAAGNLGAQTTATPGGGKAVVPPGGLSSPVGTPPAGLPGSGPGYHDPRSAFKPLEERDGVVSWKLLSAIDAKVVKNKVVPIFPPDVQALNTRTLKVQGFMLPLEPGERQRHFLLSAVPTTCNFCVPAGPEGLIEVITREPVRYTVEAITLQGRFAVLQDDKFGLFYRVAEAAIVP